MIRRALSVSALALATMTGSAFAQQPVPGAVPATAADAPNAYRAKQLLGSSVSVTGNRGVGTVDDIVLDQNGQVEYLIVANDGKLVTVPWQATTFNWEQRSAVVNITPEQYQAIPTYTTGKYPTYYAPAYRTEIYRYYGLTPGQARRIERQNDRRDDRR